MTPEPPPSPRDPARSADEFVRLVRMRDGEVTVLVHTTRWLTPCTPRSQWVVARRRTNLDSGGEGKALVAAEKPPIRWAGMHVSGVPAKERQRVPMGLEEPLLEVP